VNRLAGHFVKKASKPTANRATAHRSASTRLDGVAAAFPKGNARDHLKRWKQYGHKATPCTRSKQAAKTGRKGRRQPKSATLFEVQAFTGYKEAIPRASGQAGHVS
jgi:hypothetical protein